MERVKLAICMPVFNESSGIQEFLIDLSEEFQKFDVKFFVVDDLSTDSTKAKLQEIAVMLPIEYQRNEKNIGHGPSTIRALQLALSSDCDFVLAVDGDGQFLASEMRTLTEKCIVDRSDIGLGIRVRKGEALYRRFTSWVTRILVTLRTRSKVIDANTPLRFYDRKALKILLEGLDTDNPIPNLFISAKAIEMKLKTMTLHVAFRERRGENTQSTSWGKSLYNLPSKRFILFCYKSAKYWIKFSCVTY